MNLRPTRTATAVAALAVTTALTATACAAAGGSPQAGGARISVVASTDVWGSVVAAVGGDQVGVRSILDDPAADPHSHEGNAAEATALDGAALVVYNGGGYDDFFADMVRGTGTEARAVVAYDLSGHPAGENEHVWYDLPTVRKVADQVADALGAIRPDQKATFAANARTFDGRLDQLITKASAIGKAHPGQRAVMTEPVAKYLLDLAGVADATPPEFAEAIEQESDPSAAAVGQLTDLITRRQVSVLVNNTQTRTAITDSLVGQARAAGIEVVNVSETFPAGASDYLVWMNQQVDQLATATAKG